MLKSEKAYKIFMTAMVIIIAILLLATGIIAIQKSMKLKTSFDYIPGIDVEIYVKNDSGEELIFRNFAEGQKAVFVEAKYCTLSAGALTMNSGFVEDYGNNFSLIVYNYSDFTITAKITSTSTAKVGTDSINAVEPEITPPTAQITASVSQEFEVACEPVVPQETILSIKFEEHISAITFNSTDNLKVVDGDGVEVASVPIVEGEPTKVTIVGNGDKESWWSRSVTYSVTSGSADVSLDTLTGDFTITNPSGDVTINLSVSDSNTFRPWTYGTYVDSGASTVGTQVGYNTVYYPAFKGYKYIKFNGIDTWAPTYSSYSGDPVPLRFIIIGAGSSVSNATMLGAVQNTAVTSYAFSGTVNGKVGNNSKNDNLGASQVLLLSEQVIDRMNYGSDYGLWTHTGSTTRIFLNGDFYTNSGLSSYASYIPTPTLKTAWRYQSGTSYGETYNSQKCVEDKSSKIFVLASRNGLFTSSPSAANGGHVANTNTDYETVKFGYQNYCVEDYLGTSDATFTFKVPTETSFSGGNCTYGDAKLKSIAGMHTTHWWLRSGYSIDGDYAYLVSLNGYVSIGTVFYSSGVRPSFILNLA